jgi:hypothetical protein
MRIEIETIKSEIRNSRSEMGMPIFLPQGVVASGPHAYFKAANVPAKIPVKIA